MQRSAMLLSFLLCTAGTTAEVSAGQVVEMNVDAAAENRPRHTADPVAVPEPSEKAMRFYRSGNVLWIVSQLLSLAIPSLILFTGLSARIRTLARGIGRKWFFVVAIYFILFALLEYVLSFPLAIYAGYLRKHAYGLSNQTLAKWLADSVKSQAVGMVFGVLLLWLPYLLMRRSPRRWWFYTGLLSVPVMFFVMLVEPIWVAPMFNRFGPMKDKQLETRILALADQAGIEGGHVFEVDKSVDTKTVNAYVTGLLNTKRIVLWDTLLAKLDADQVLFVMAHEMGHYVLHHVLLGILAGSCGILIGLYLIHRLSAVLIRRFQRQFGFEQLSDVASLPLIVLLAQLISLVVMPVGLALSRHMERESDRFGLELTQDNHAAATAFVRLQDENLANPRPGTLFMLWRGSHPSIGQRIDFANSYRPWDDGRPLRYGRLFREPGDGP